MAVRSAKNLLQGEIDYPMGDRPAYVRDEDELDSWDDTDIHEKEIPWLLVIVGYFFAFVLLSAIHPALAAAYFVAGFIAYFSPSFFPQGDISADWRYFCFPWMAWLDYSRAKEASEE